MLELTGTDLLRRERRDGGLTLRADDFAWLA